MKFSLPRAVRFYSTFQQGNFMYSDYTVGEFSFNIYSSFMACHVIIQYFKSDFYMDIKEILKLTRIYKCSA